MQTDEIIILCARFMHERNPQNMYSNKVRRCCGKGNTWGGWNEGIFRLSRKLFKCSYSKYTNVSS